MKRQSWIVLTVCAVVIAGMIGSYIMSQGGAKQLSEQDAIDITTKMERAFHNKNANGMMGLSMRAPTCPERIASINIFSL